MQETKWDAESEKACINTYAHAYWVTNLLQNVCGQQNSRWLTHFWIQIWLPNKNGVSHRRISLLPAHVVQADLRPCSLNMNVNSDLFLFVRPKSGCYCQGPFIAAMFWPLFFGPCFRGHDGFLGIRDAPRLTEACPRHEDKVRLTGTRIYIILLLASLSNDWWCGSGTLWCLLDLQKYCCLSKLRQFWQKGHCRISFSEL